MGNFYLLKDGVLCATGSCPDGMECEMAQEGCELCLGTPSESARPVPPPPDYRELRRAAYPPITDYLDAIVKGDEQQLAAYIEKCRAIKEKYPPPIDGYLDAFDDGDDDDVYI